MYIVTYFYLHVYITEDCPENIYSDRQALKYLPDNYNMIRKWVVSKILCQKY